MAMVFCRGCGKEIHESALSCPQCGAQQRQAASNGNTNPLRERVLKEVSSSKISFVDTLLLPFRMFRKLVLTENHLLLTNSGKTRIYVDIPLSDITSVGYANGGSLGFPPGYLLPTAIAVSTTTGNFKFNFGLLNYSKRKEWVEAIKAQTSGTGAQSFLAAAQSGRLQPSLDASPVDGKRPAIVVGAVVVALLLIGLFSSMKGTSTTPAVAAAPPPTSAMSASSSSGVDGQAPQPSAAFKELYQVTPAANGTANLNDGQIASLYYAATFMTEAGQRHLIFVQRSKPGQESYADAGNIDVISFRNDGGQWVPDAQARGVFAAGAYGGTAALTVEESAKVERHALRDDVTGVFLPSSSSHQGYSTDFLEIVGVGSRKVGYLGQVEVAGNNAGACDPSEKSGAQACYDWKGKVEIAAAQPGQFSKITVKKTGTEHAGPAIVRASSTVYTKSQDGGYAAPND